MMHYLKYLKHEHGFKLMHAELTIIQALSGTDKRSDQRVNLMLAIREGLEYCLPHGIWEGEKGIDQSRMS